MPLNRQNNEPKMNDTKSLYGLRTYEHTKLPYGHTPFINKRMSTATRHINIYLYLLHGAHRFFGCCSDGCYCSTVAANDMTLSVYYLFFLSEYFLHATRILNQHFPPLRLSSTCFLRLEFSYVANQKFQWNTKEE